MKTTYHPELLLLEVRWLADSDGPGLQAEYESLLNAEPAHEAMRWLLDIRCRPTPTLEMANWVTLNWMPRAAARLAPQRLCVAYVISPQRAEALAADPELQANLADALAPNRLYHMALFGDTATARQWLLS